MKSRDDSPSSVEHVEPHERMKTIQVGEQTWLLLCMMKFSTHSRSLDEVISRLLNRREVQTQMSLFLESARYGELSHSSDPELFVDKSRR